MPAGLGAGGQHARAQAQLLGHAGRARARGPARGRRRPSGLLQVPLVEHERGRAAGLHRQLGDAQILGGDAVAGVADDERDVGALGGALRAQRRVVLDRVGDLRLAAHAGRVDEHQPAPVDHQRHVDRVARRAGELGDDHALLAEEAVDERGLADVGPADHGQADASRRPRARSSAGQQLDDAVEQIARAEALRRGDGHRLAEPEPVELGGERHLGDAVALVGRDDRRQRRRGAAARRAPRRRAARRRARRRRAPPARRRRAPRAPARGSSRRAGPRRGSRRRRCRSA